MPTTLLGVTEYSSFDFDKFNLSSPPGVTTVVNGVSDGTVTKDNVVKTYSENLLQTHTIASDEFLSKFLGRTCILSMDYYIPSGQTNVDAAVVRMNATAETRMETVGSWASITTPILNVGSSGTVSIEVGLRKGLDGLFTGEGDPNDDILYFTNVRVYVADPAICLVSANDFADISASVSGAPRIFANRTNNSNTSVDVTIDHIGTPAYENVRLYVSDDHRGQFSVLENKTTLPYTHSTAIGTAVNNYKYRATYAATGTKGGTPYDEESAPSRPVYTTGTRTI